MPIEFKCEKCGLNLGEMERGKVRKQAILLCGNCWQKAFAAMNIAELARKETPEVLKDLFKGFDKEKANG